jgi:uncharacterized repeat protein (TIGR01451 family)
MVTVVALAAPQLTLAAGPDTNYGTTISNSASIQYGSGPSTITTNASVDFLVDRVLDWNISPSTAATVGVFPGSTNNAVAFSVQNTTNGVVDLLLAFPASAPAPSGGALMYLDVGGTPGAWDAGDTLLPTGAGGFYLDEVAEDAAPSVLIVVDVPSAATTTDAYTYEITATARAGGGAAALGAVLSDDSGSAESSTQVQNVYNDGIGYTGGSGDGTGDGVYRAYAAFQVATASLTATKTAVVSDIRPFNNTNPKAIPGAIVHYTITVSNTGTADATGVDISDNIPADTTYVGPLTATGGGFTLDDSGDPLLATGGTIIGGGSVDIEFDVSID